MSFWSTTGPEPKRSYRWIVRFGGTGGASDISFALKKVTKPKSKIAATTHKYLNHAFKYPGRLEWEAITMTFASVSGPDATDIINRITLQAGYGVPYKSDSPADQLSTIGKNKFRGALGDSIDIIQVDANGEDIEKWQLFNPFFTNISYGSLDYSSEDIVEIECGVEYDWAKLTTRNASDDNEFGNKPRGGGNFP